jgi:hypothetical protein
MYELNEVPWKVIDFYTSRHPQSCLAKILKLSKCYTTFTNDVGELHPWVTWPTLHRGVDNTVHKIEFLNQDLTEANAYPPLWETASKAGLSVGVFGSLQSYPVPQDTEYAFYVPDTFAPAPDAYPARYVPLQELNLQQTAADGGIVSDVKPSVRMVVNALRLFQIGLSLKTLVRIARQLMLEKTNPAYKTRRAVLQAPIQFDVFKHALRKTMPDLCTIFTNHVAGMMHRYWRHTFPDDFGGSSSLKPDPVRCSNIEYAMSIADEQIAFLKKHADAVGASLLIVSSMGQEAIHRRGGDQARILDIPKFMRTLGFSKQFKSHLAMHPDFNFEFETVEDVEHFADLLGQFTFADGRGLAYKINVMGCTLNFGLAQPPDHRDQNVIIRTSADGVNWIVPFEEAGMIRFERDVGTAYHQPRGIAIWYEPGGVPDGSRAEIDSREVRPMVLRALGLSDPLAAVREAGLVH